MKPKEALDYFWTYYKIHLMFLAIILFFLVLILQANFGKKQELVFSAMLVDTGISQEAADSAAEECAAFLKLNTQTQKITMDATVSFDGGTVAGVQKLLVSVAAGEIDAVLTNTVVADYLLKGGAVSDLQTILSQETLEHFADNLVYADPEALSAWTAANRSGEAEDVVLISKDPSEMTSPVPIGIDITEACAAAFDRPASYGEVILTVAVTTRRQEETEKFLDYLESLGGGR